MAVFHLQKKSDIHVNVHIVHLHCDLWSIIFQNSFPHSLHLQKNKVYLCSAMIKFFLLLCSLEAEEVATHGAPEAWKEARERVDKTFQVFFHTFLSPAQYILYLIQLNCTKVNDDVNDEYEDNDDDDDDNDGADNDDTDRQRLQARRRRANMRATKPHQKSHSGIPSRYCMVHQLKSILGRPAWVGYIWRK